MFERYWKPYFDTVTNNTGNFLEKVLANPAVLQSLSGTLNSLFRVKMAADKAMHLMFKGIGLPTYRDQKKVLYFVTKLEGQLEDLQDQLQVLEDWRHDIRTLQELREQVAVLQEQVNRYQQLESSQTAEETVLITEPPETVAASTKESA